MEKLFIHATNVHRGGGRSLLEALLRGLPETTQVVLSVDSRMPLPETLSRNIVVQRVPPTVIQRLNAERKLAESVATGDVALCFGNLPPLFKLRGRTIVFMQNRYLIEDVSLSEFPFPLRLRLTMERLWLSLKMKHADEFVVQTPTMKRWMEMKTRARIPVRVLPFLAEDSGFSRKGSQPVLPKKKDLDFVYVASGEPYKNHRMLIEAWCLLAQGGIFPSLKLTVDRGHFGELCSWMEEKVAQYRLKVWSP